MNLVKLDFPDNVLVALPVLLASGVLRDFFDLDLAVLCDDILHIKLQESIE